MSQGNETHRAKLVDDVQFNDSLRERLAGSNILISGSKGFIGSNLWNLLKKASELEVIKPAKIVRISRSSFTSSLEVVNGVEMISMSNEYFLSNPFDIDYLFHLASPSNITKIQKLEDVSIPNTLFLKSLLNCVRRQALYFSSSEIYRILKIENAHTFPHEITLEKRNWYPASKLAGENICTDWLKNNPDQKLSIIRLFHTYGPDLSIDDGRSFADFLWQSILADKIVLKSDGQQKRTFLYISDALSAFLKLIEGDHNDIEIVDVGSEREISILQFAQLVSEITDRRLSVEPDNSFDHSKDLVLVPNLQRLRAIGWTEKVNLETGIMKTLEFMRKKSLN